MLLFLKKLILLNSVFIIFSQYSFATPIDFDLNSFSQHPRYGQDLVGTGEGGLLYFQAVDKIFIHQPEGAPQLPSPRLMTNELANSAAFFHTHYDEWTHMSGYDNKGFVVTLDPEIKKIMSRLANIGGYQVQFVRENKESYFKAHIDNTFLISQNPKSGEILRRNFKEITSLYSKGLGDNEIFGKPIPQRMLSLKTNLTEFSSTRHAVLEIQSYKDQLMNKKAIMLYLGGGWGYISSTRYGYLGIHTLREILLDLSKLYTVQLESIGGGDQFRVRIFDDYGKVLHAFNTDKLASIIRQHDKMGLKRVQFRITKNIDAQWLNSVIQSVFAELNIPRTSNRNCVQTIEESKY